MRVLYKESIFSCVVKTTEVSASNFSGVLCAGHGSAFCGDVRRTGRILLFSAVTDPEIVKVNEPAVVNDNEHAR